MRASSYPVNPIISLFQPNLKQDFFQQVNRGLGRVRRHLILLKNKNQEGIKRKIFFPEQILTIICITMISTMALMRLSPHSLFFQSKPCFLPAILHSLHPNLIKKTE